MQLGQINIDSRFRGPPNSGNGGYVAGRVAAFIDGPAEVTLRRPPPLDTALDVVREDDGTVALMDGEVLVASACEAAVEIDPGLAPSFDAALQATQRSMDPCEHNLPGCFVCGPQREQGDGMRIFAGPIDPQDTNWRGLLAAPWTPAPDLAADSMRERRSVAPEFVWAALDCPTGYTSFGGGGGDPALLGRLSLDIRQLPRVREKCVIAAWQTEQEGRKHFAHGALFAENGTVLALAKATWIKVDRAVMLGGG